MQDFWEFAGFYIETTLTYGCGKRTLLNLLGSLDHPTNGSIELDGINVAVLSGKEEVKYRLSKVGFIFQSYNFVPYLKAIENVMLPMEFKSLSAHERNLSKEVD